MSNADHLTERVAALSPAKRALLEREIRKRKEARGVSIRRRREDEALPLSFGQQRLWFLNQLEPNSYAYNEPYAVRLHGFLNVEALRQALDQIVKRHEILRTSFVWLGGQPQQRIAAATPFELPVNDLSSRAEDSREAEAQAYLHNVVREPFDFRSDVLLRAFLVRLAEQEHILLLLTHHIASDGWSRGILCEELGSFYESFAFGAPVSAPALQIQYADYAIWQRELLQGEHLDRQLSYWRDRLGGAAPLELPTDRARPRTQRYHGAQHSFNLASGLTERLIAFNRLENTTHFMTLLAAFQVLLSRLSGQEDVALGTPIANRQRVELENLIGFFVNTLVLRTDLSGQPSFRECVRRVRTNALDAYQHQDLPFNKLVEELNPERDLSRHPLFQVMFVLQNVPAHPLSLRGLELTPYSVATGATPFDLDLHLSPAGDTYTGMLTYDTDLFDHGTIERLASHYSILLEAMLAEPDLPVFKATMLSEAERHQLVVEWNSNAIEYPAPECIHQLFEEQAQKSPDAIAVEFGEHTLTYRELNRRADCLAGHLQNLGIERETAVGVCVERSTEMVVALLAILKAGGTFVPIDNHFPPDRISGILSDAGARLLVLHESLHPLCRGFKGTIVSLDQELPNESEKRLAANVSGRAAAYIYFTSGSTGRPKGVVIEHHSVVNFLRGMRERPGIHATDVVLALTTISFDPAVLDIFLPLSVGARIVIAPEEIRADADQLLKLLQRCGATMLQATPTTWQLLLQKNWTRKELKALIGGEILTPELAREILARCGELWNIYGPTETTVWSTVAPITSADDISIGRPIANQRTYVVDARDQLVPIGVPGELLIGGAGLGRYYLSQPEMTAERFIPDPFSSGENARLYRTGDVCRYRADGNLEYLGRVDHQLKIRGHRVEPGEIEAVLVEHPAISQCAVVARVEHSGENRLVGYIKASDPASAPDIAALREFLKRKLPDYMVPAAFVILERLPLTRTGKIDRAALPAPAPTIRISPYGSAAPRNEIERQLLRIWEKVLQMVGIGLTDDFFQIGGHSLMAVRLMAEVNSAFGLQLPLATIFRAPTIEGLAAMVASGNELHSRLPGLIVPTEDEGGERVFWMPSVGSVERFVECHHLARLLRTRYRFFGFDPAPNITGIGALADHCVKLIRAEQPAGPYFLAGYCQCGHVAYEVATRLKRDGHDIALLAIIDSSARDFAPGLRQRLRWVRDGFRGKPRTVLRRVRSVVRQKFGRGTGSNGHGTADGVPVSRFAAHMQAVNRHRVRSFSGTIELIRSEEWLARLPHSPKLGWDALAGAVRVHPVNCQHLSVLTDAESLDTISDIMKQALKSCKPV